MYLELDGQTLQLTTENGYHVRSVDFGFPEVRTVTDSRPLADGNDDRTRFFGARAVSLSMTLVGDKWTLLDQLAQYLNPAARPFLVYDDAAQPRRIRLRAAEQSGVITSPTNQHDVLVQWSAPDGAAETLNQSTATVPASKPAEDGWEFDLTFNIQFPSTPPVSTAVPVLGNAKCYPVIQLWGPCTDPRIVTLTDRLANGTPKALTFSGISLNAQEYIEVNVRERTVLRNGRANQPRYQFLDFEDTNWFTLLPGTNFLRYDPVTFSGTARAVILYRCSFL